MTEERQKRESSWRVLKKFFKYLKNYTWYALFLLMGIFLTSAVTIASPYLLKVIVDEALPGQNFSQLLNILIIWVSIIGLTSVASYYVEYLREWLRVNIAVDIRETIFAHLLSLPVSYFKENDFGDILHKINDEVDEIENVLTGEVFRFIESAFLLLGIVVGLNYLSTSLLLIALTITPLFALNFIIFKPRYEKQSEDIQNKEAGLFHFFTDRLDKIGLIKVFHAKHFEQHALRTKTRQLIEARLGRARTSSVFTVVSAFLVYFGPVTILFAGGRQVIAGTMTIGTLIASFQYLSQIFYPIADLTESQMDFTRAMVSMRRINTLLEEPQERTGGQSVQLIGNHSQRIEFRHVDYYKNDNHILKDLSLQLNLGKKYALIGHSGSGKTTLLELLFQFYTPDSGSIQFNGLDIKDYDLEEWRRQFVLVSQGRQLLDETIDNNIRYGAVGKNGHRDTQEEAKHISQLTPVLGNELLQNLGHSAKRLSGGEAQRIAIARAILKKTQVILLDESTSAIDAQAEKQIINYLTDIWHDKTVLLVSHRLSTIMFMDEIICMDNGLVVERGSYKEIVAKQGIGWELLKHQLTEST